ncbi:unnamed protein product, partial [Heterotrigona itama]
NRRGREKHFDFPVAGNSECETRVQSEVSCKCLTSIFIQCYNVALHRWIDNIENNTKVRIVGFPPISSMTFRHLNISNLIVSIKQITN